MICVVGSHDAVVLSNSLNFGVLFAKSKCQLARVHVEVPTFCHTFIVNLEHANCAILSQPLLLSLVSTNIFLTTLWLAKTVAPLSFSPPAFLHFLWIKISCGCGLASPDGACKFLSPCFLAGSHILLHSHFPSLSFPHFLCFLFLSSTCFLICSPTPPRHPLPPPPPPPPPPSPSSPPPRYPLPPPLAILSPPPLAILSPPPPSLSSPPPPRYPLPPPRYPLPPPLAILSPPSLSSPPPTFSLCLSCEPY